LAQRPRPDATNGGDAGMRLRRAVETDWPAIWPLWHEVVAAGDTYCYDPRTDIESGRALWFGPVPEQTWVAEQRGQVLGTYHLSPNQAGPGAHIANASYMVRSDARGRGLGRRMVEHSLRTAAAAGFRGVQFNAVAATNVHAIRLYHELGFATIGTVPAGFRHPRAGFTDLLIMFREL